MGGMRNLSHGSIGIECVSVRRSCTDGKCGDSAVLSSSTELGASFDGCIILMGCFPK